MKKREKIKDREEIQKLEELPPPTRINFFQHHLHQPLQEPSAVCDRIDKPHLVDVLQKLEAADSRRNLAGTDLSKGEVTELSERHIAHLIGPTSVRVR